VKRKVRPWWLFRPSTVRRHVGICRKENGAWPAHSSRTRRIFLLMIELFSFEGPVAESYRDAMNCGEGSADIINALLEGSVYAD